MVRTRRGAVGRAARLVLGLLVAAATAAGVAPGARRAVAEDGVAVFRGEPDLRGLEVERVEWMGMFLASARVGWARETLRRRGEGGDAAFVATSTVRLRLRAMDQVTDVRETEERVFDGTPPYALRSARHVEAEGDAVRVIEVARDGGSLRRTVTEDGVARALPPVEGVFTLRDDLALRTWCRAGPKVGDRARFVTFDADEARLGEMAVRVTSVARPGGPGSAAYELVTVDDDGSEGRLSADETGRIRWMSFGSRIEARAETEQEATRLAEGEDLFRLTVAPVDRPLGDARKVARLVLEAEGDLAVGLLDAPRQRVRREAGAGVVVVTLGAKDAPSPASDDEVRRALEETVEYPIHLPAVKALAAGAVAGATDPAERVAALLAFVDGFLVDAEVPGTVSIARLLAAPRGDCTEHAALFVTLARAVGVPARVVGGVMYLGDEERAFGGHAWAEVALGGSWIQVDPTWRQSTVDATHVVLERDRPGGSPGPPFGTLSFRVREVTFATR
ncbi:MAG: transglutaminase-like domain-containing protein [Planctomycetota bacterium]